MPDLTALLENAKTIAVVGCSDDPSRTSYAIARYLQAAGYRVVPVNPHCGPKILGEPCYPDLQRIPDDVQIDLVNIFRRRPFTADMVRMAVERAEATGTKPGVWTQLGVHSPEAQQVAEAAGLPYVAERCIMVEHRMRIR